MRLDRHIPLPHVEGRIDHMALDAAGQRLFVAALGADRVEVVDLKEGSVAHVVMGLAEPQGVVFLPATGRFAVACGRDGSLRYYDGATYAPADVLDLGDDADNVRFEADTGRLYVGFGEGGIAVVEKAKKTAEMRLPGHPEAFALQSKGPRIFVNVPGAGSVVVLDREKGKVLATWALKDARSNFPMALDEVHNRLLVGCRDPARLVVLDAADGHAVSSVEIAGDVDDVFVEEGSRRAFASCGEGFVDVLMTADGDRWARTARVATAPGARTSFLDSKAGRLYVAVPHRGSQAAEIRVYAIAP